MNRVCLNGGLFDGRFDGAVLPGDRVVLGTPVDHCARGQQDYVPHSG
jgi:hypothetical protein